MWREGRQHIAVATSRPSFATFTATLLRWVRAKDLERIADHATNVAEEVIFMVRADDVRHGRWQLAGAIF